MEKYSAREKTREEIQKEREEKQAKIWKHEVNRKKKGQAGSNEKFSRWIAQCSQKEQVRRKSIISGGKGQVVVQRKTIEKDLEAEGGNPHRVWLKT